jgi:hypothetical protein
MNMRVDDAGKDREIASIDLRLRGARQVPGESDNLSLTHSDVLLASHEQIEIAHEKNDEARMTKHEGMTKPE